MSYTTGENSFFRKQRKLSTGYVQWCGNPEQESEVPVYYGATSKASKISMKDLNKRKQQKQKTNAIPQVRPVAVEPRLQFAPMQPRSKVNFCYQKTEPSRNENYNFQLRNTGCCQPQTIKFIIKPAQQPQKDTTYQSYLTPIPVNTMRQGLKSSRNLSQSKRLPKPKLQDDMMSEPAKKLSVGSSFISLGRSLAQDQDDCSNDVLVDEPNDISSFEVDKKFKDQLRGTARSTQQGTSCVTGLSMVSSNSAANHDFSCGTNKLQRNKYTKGKLLSNIRKIDTMFSEQDDKSQTSEQSQVIDNYQSLMDKIREQHQQSEQGTPTLHHF